MPPDPLRMARAFVARTLPPPPPKIMTLAKPLLIYNLQSAFRTGHSTETALIRLTDEILLNMDMDEVTGLVFIDFRKAFDTVDHKLLLRKLPIYGASDAAVSWIKSYLSNRKQFVNLGNQSSELLPIKQGVPQGSIFGPVLFLLFVNDMPLNIFKSTMDIYADDTTISSSANWNEISKLQEALLEDLVINPLKEFFECTSVLHV